MGSVDFQMGFQVTFVATPAVEFTDANKHSLKQLITGIRKLIRQCKTWKHYWQKHSTEICRTCSEAQRILLSPNFLNYCFLFCFQSVPVYEGILKILCLCIMKLTQLKLSITFLILNRLDMNVFLHPVFVLELYCTCLKSSQDAGR